MPRVPDVPLDGLYGDIILDHCRNPRHHVAVPDADFEAEEYNPFCGDRATLQLKLDGQGCVVQVGVRSEGCSIVRASASLMAEALQGKELGELNGLAEHFRGLMQGKTPPEEAAENLSRLEPLTAVRLFPVRIKCALLPWTALEEGIKGYRSSQTRDQ
tara:strand:+ start:102 stop:575 length:474 start_codon:yes stop_codon:yes gene_type:complete